MSDAAVSRTQNTGSLYATIQGIRRIDTDVDRLNATFDDGKFYSGNLPLTLQHDAALLRIPFNRASDQPTKNDSTPPRSAGYNPFPD